MKFDDYDLANEETFPELALEYYLERVFYDDVMKVESMPWARMLSNARILNLLRIPHIERHPIIIVCVRHLIALAHDGCLWIQNKIQIDVALIHWITDLPKKVPHPMAQYGKTWELKVAARVKKYYKVGRDSRGFLVQPLKDPVIHLGTLVIGCKLRCKCCPKVVLAHFITLERQCEKGVSYNWS